MDGWQPIESAPKDGTLLRLKSPKYMPNQPFWWDKKEGRWATLVVAVARTVDGWWAEEEEQPTHWMPVPASPTSPASEQALSE